MQEIVCFKTRVIMTEIGVLTLCFVLTFGILGFKLKDFVAKFLDNYSKKIEDDVNYSEQLKKKAIYALDQAQKEENEINSKIKDIEYEYIEKKISLEKQIKEKMEKNVEKIMLSYTSRKQNDYNELLEMTKTSIIKSILSCVDGYIQSNLDIKQMNDAELRMLKKVNFKKLFG